ncbi:MAG: glutathionylspermidine synthase family protein [Burkholderiaceae bacterium]|jgi:glutathionylspermidine synthase|nr:glutathionylspermidine synthase family protein [Burkholderiaceae bacterium]
MQRQMIAPREKWQAAMEALGFRYHSIDGTYWDESRCYRFDSDEIDAIDDATAELHARCLDAAAHVVERGRMDEFAIARAWQPLVAQSWRDFAAGAPQGFSLFGRMDLVVDGAQPPRLLEYNADTPTACLEASVAQWDWLQAMRPRLGQGIDQFNSLHEKLVAAWQRLLALHRADDPQRPARLHFAAVEDSAEDWGNVDYLRDCAMQAGWTTFALPVERIGLQRDAGDAAAGLRFVDAFNVPIERLFKLYPWEWLVREDFAEPLARAVADGALQLIEPPWKMLLANKALLPVLWELFPDHPNLLPAYTTPDKLGSRYVRKPKLAREGANVTLVDGPFSEASDGGYGAEGFVYQALAPLPRFGRDHVVVGSWVVDGVPAGIGLREDDTPITRNTSRFVPHYFV